MKEFIIRAITGVIFVTAIVVSFLNPMALVFLFSVVTGLTIWELCGLLNKRPHVQVNQFISSVSGTYLFLCMAGHCSGWVTSGTVFIPYLITIIYLLIAELYLKAEDPINNWAYTMLPQLYVALPLSTINVLAFPAAGQYSMFLPLSVFVFLWINDTGAYLCGSLFGRHKLFPRVSPGKSWEGSIGGGVLVVLVSLLVWHLLDLHAPGGAMLNHWQWMGLGLTVVVFGTWGDLVESLLKRTLHIKDSGNVLPGHGGMLDRFDSSLLAIPAAVVYLFTLSLL